MSFAHARLFTRANLLTFARLGIAPLLALSILRGESVHAAVLFWLAVATDVLDGRVARRYGEASPLGGLLDHAIDATLVTLGNAALVARGALPLPLPPLIALAFLQYTFDSRALRGRALRTSALGRTNGIAYYVILAIPPMRDALALGFPDPGLVRALGWLLVASTLVSMGDRLQALARQRNDPPVS